MKTRILWIAALACICQGPLFGWGGQIHGEITRAAISSLPPWQLEVLKDEKELLAEQYSLIPDNVYLPQFREEYGPLVVLPDGTRFTHEPHDRAHNEFLMRHYVERSIEHFRKGDVRLGAKYLGCLLHFLEDSGSPSHSIPGDNQLSLLRDMLQVPEAFRDQPLHSFVENGIVNLAGFSYQPRLLGETADEAAFHLVERLNDGVRNARAQLIPILQGVFDGKQTAVDAGRKRAAVVDAQVAADAIYTILSISYKKFEPVQQESLRKVDWTLLTPLEVVSQTYFPQFTYFSDPYFGYPVRDSFLVMALGESREPLALRVDTAEGVSEKVYESGLGVGTHTRLSYGLPRLTYDRIEFVVGLHSRLGKEGKIVAKVYADGVAVHSTGLLTGEHPAQKVSLPIWGVREISIEIESRNERKGSNAVVLADAVLHRATKQKSDPRQQVK